MAMAYGYTIWYALYESYSQDLWQVSSNVLLTAMLEFSTLDWHTNYGDFWKILLAKIFENPVPASYLIII